jgi:hypothetical protein
MPCKRHISLQATEFFSAILESEQPVHSGSMNLITWPDLFSDRFLSSCVQEKLLPVRSGNGEFLQRISENVDIGYNAFCARTLRDPIRGYC